MTGQTLGHYRLEALVGEGGLGVVYRARSEVAQASACRVGTPADAVFSS